MGYTFFGKKGIMKTSFLYRKKKMGNMGGFYEKREEHH